MQIINHRNKSVDVHQFAMVPKAEVPRSTFIREFTHKTSFDENYLIPFYVDEVIPGDTFSMQSTIFARLSTPIYPVMDNLYLDTFYFFVPNRLIWTHWVNFMGEQANPADTISYTIPTANTNVGGYSMGSLQDYMGLPTVGQVTGGSYVTHNNLPCRAYNKIWNDWFRDENLQNSVTVDLGDGPDAASNYSLLKRGKRHDYFTSGLPWTQKGRVAVTIPLGTSAPVTTSSSVTVVNPANALNLAPTGGGNWGGNYLIGGVSGGRTSQAWQTPAPATSGGNFAPTNLYADLTTATAATINQLRQSFQIQKLLERDARGGTRYTELIRAHFGVVNPDFRLQRSEYLGGGSTPVNIAAIPQTAQTGLTGGTTPLGTLGAHAAVTAQHGFTQSFTEHGYVIGLCNIRADLTYQQGLRKLWSRNTRYDFYFPAFAMLGEQAILNNEIYCVGSGTGGRAPGDQDQQVFAYQERWGEMRYLPSMITGAMRSTYATPLDAWHLAEKFTALPTLGATFIQQNSPVSRVIATPVANTHFIMDSYHRVKTTRPMPLYSVPGLIDHF